jgi:acetolactate decarboxylase
MNKPFFSFLWVLMMLACQNQKSENTIPEEKKSDQIYQYSLFTALANSIYDGNLTVAEVKEHGDLGLGTFNGLNGEMIVHDGSVYQFLADGTVRQPDNHELAPFVVVTFFEKGQIIEIQEPTNYNELKTLIETRLPSENLAYAFKIKGNFQHLKCGSADRQEKPYGNTLSEAIADRPTFEWENITGAMVGFWFPEYVGGVNISGFHLHFISDDKKMAGHVLEFQAKNLTAEVDICDGFDVVLPQTQEFNKASFDLSQQYNNPGK